MERRAQSRPVDRPKPKLKAAARRSQLVTIAMDLIAEKGFEGLRFQEVAERAGINNGTLVSHFAGKEELILAVLGYISEALRETPGLPAGRPPTAVEQLRLEFASAGRLMREQPKLFQALTELWMRGARDQTLGGVLATLQREWSRHLIEVLELGVKEGAFRPGIDVEGTATAIMAQIKGIGFHAITGRLTPDEIERAVTEIARQSEYWLMKGKP